MSASLAAILGGAAGAVALVGISILLIWFCISRSRSVSRTSETGSSDPSVQVGRHGGVELSMRETRRFQMEELSLATKNFSDKNLIGQGKFGEVYMGFLQDGMLVAIKKRPGTASQEFINEVHYLSAIQHRNIVTLLGYCQENNLQFLVYEYIHSGSVSSHLYGTGQHSREKLEFKNRLTIAQGAAKGLAHLHSLSPRLVHKDFKTANVLVDENFIAKVADAGIRNFLGRVDIAGSSSQVTADEMFLAPEVREFRRFSEKSDVYSFGVFLLELVSGREARDFASSDSTQNMVEWVQNIQEGSNVSCIIDERLGNSFTGEAMEGLIQLIMRCVEASSERRPGMSHVVMELDRIVEKEMSLTTIMGEGTSTSPSSFSSPTAPPSGNTHPHLPPPSQGATSSEASPSTILIHEYTRAVQSQSYNEIWSKVQLHDHDQLQEDDDNSHHHESEAAAASVGASASVQLRVRPRGASPRLAQHPHSPSIQLL
ncbi:hypothetical protein DVH24_037483 [Malus domestica]|uniref:non-specific serine/threonine protein kinase n=1 Tax=Malus domestica TaxID=3750 RepID=A0A498HFB3_MALDO|nr:hypothetical protein DVH24_037483 [Malus domestica]